MAGRPRIPDEVHILEGTFRADRHGDPSSEVVADGEPVRPDHLKDDALAFWQQVVPGLVASGLAKERDAAELAAMCEWWARYRKLSKALDKMAVTNKQYYQTTINTAVAWDKFNGIATRFGLTPADRAKMRQPVNQSKKSGVMSRKRNA